jgi:hypothetical protein
MRVVRGFCDVRYRAIKIGELAGKLCPSPAALALCRDSCRRSRNLSSSKMTGRRNTNNELSRRLLDDRLESSRKIGIFSRYGIPLIEFDRFFCVKPPTMIV